MRYIFIAVIAVILTISASFAEEPQKNEEPITTEQFVPLYVDLSIAAERFLEDSVKLAEMQDSIFAAHKVSRSSFDDFRAKMDSEPEKWAQVWDKIVKELELRDREATRKKKQEKKQQSR